MAVMMDLASPAWAQDSTGPNYGPNGTYYGPYDYCGWSPYACKYTPGERDSRALNYGPNGAYYGPYDYCGWSPYACKYTPDARTSSTASPPSQLPATGGLDAIPLLGLGGGALVVAAGMLVRRMIQ